MKKPVFFVIGLVMTLALLIGAPARSAHADYADFYPYGFGSLNWAGGNAGLAGALDVNSAIDYLSSGVSILPISSGSSYGPNGGLLTFSTGAYTGIPWNFAPGGSFSLAGGIAILGIGSGATLLSGNLGAVSIAIQQEGPGVFLDTVSASFTGIINSVLAQHFSLPSTSVSGEMSFSFVVDAPLSSNGFSYSSNGASTQGGGNGDGSPLPLPIPSALLLFAPGLLGLAATRRRGSGA